MESICKHGGALKIMIESKEAAVTRLTKLFEGDTEIIFWKYDACVFTKIHSYPTSMRR